jgi:hypothetical protein
MPSPLQASDGSSFRRAPKSRGIEYFGPVGTISAIKLKRTDTTLDLSLMAKGSWRKREEKVLGESGVFVGGKEALNDA